MHIRTLTRSNTLEEIYTECKTKKLKAKSCTFHAFKTESIIWKGKEQQLVIKLNLAKPKIEVKWVDGRSNIIKR